MAGELQHLAAAMLRVLQQARAPRALLAGWPDGEAVPVVAHGLPALRHLPHAMAVTAPETEALTAQVIAFVAALDWRQSFGRADLPAAFLDNYAWTEIIGPGGPMRANRLAAGFLLLGPRTAFPPHRHAAEEFYVALAGTAYWQHGRRPFIPKPPGQTVHHGPWLPHAMRTADEPMLAMYVWRGDELAHPPLLG